MSFAVTTPCPECGRRSAVRTTSAEAIHYHCAECGQDAPPEWLEQLPTLGLAFDDRTDSYRVSVGETWCRVDCRAWRTVMTPEQRAVVVAALSDAEEQGVWGPLTHQDMARQFERGVAELP